MIEDLLNLVERPPAVDQEAGVLVAEVVDPQVRQSRLHPDSVPDPVTSALMVTLDGHPMGSVSGSKEMVHLDSKLTL